jgi:apoptosis-inducing factor 3
MGDAPKPLDGPDLTQGVAISTLSENTALVGHAHGEQVMLVRRGDELFAIGASCTHYGGPLSEGVFVDDTVRCPWHHACFSLRTGEALRAPALDAVSCWNVEQQEDRAHVTTKRERSQPAALGTRDGLPAAVTIVGGGAAGNAAAEMLRRLGYGGAITMFSADAAAPCDRPNLSKGYLSGAMSADSNPLRPEAFYQEHRIDLRLNARVAAIDPVGRRLQLADGSRAAYDALLLATGAEPVRLVVPGASLPHVRYLRTQADSDALVAAAKPSTRAVIVGSSFIGLEVASSLRARDVTVDVVAPEAVPMERTLGTEVGTFIRGLHERHGVTFHLRDELASIDDRHVTLRSGARLPASLVVVGIGVRPAVGLAEKAGLKIDKGIAVDEYLETSVPGIFAAGDIARWPDVLTGERIRVEHWVVAERQGQVAARNILGRRTRFDAVPFFWTEQYDFTLSYVGHAERWDSVEIDGALDAVTQDCTVTYRREGKKLAVAVVHRDLAGLQAEAEFEKSTNARATTRPTHIGTSV